MTIGTPGLSPSAGAARSPSGRCCAGRQRARTRAVRQRPPSPLQRSARIPTSRSQSLLYRQCLFGGKRNSPYSIMPFTPVSTYIGLSENRQKGSRMSETVGGPEIVRAIICPAAGIIGQRVHPRSCADAGRRNVALSTFATERAHRMETTDLPGNPARPGSNSPGPWERVLAFAKTRVQTADADDRTLSSFALLLIKTAEPGSEEIGGAARAIVRGIHGCRASWEG